MTGHWKIAHRVNNTNPQILFENRNEHKMSFSLIFCSEMCTITWTEAERKKSASKYSITLYVQTRAALISIFFEKGPNTSGCHHCVHLHSGNFSHLSAHYTLSGRTGRWTLQGRLDTSEKSKRHRKARRDAQAPPFLTTPTKSYRLFSEPRLLKPSTLTSNDVHI